ncbi:MAG TPA: hypothetical protein ENH31_04175 [Nitrospirae bacterium]|nr:hypothetical protein [Nitrospirota bacterium]
MLCVKLLTTNKRQPLIFTDKGIAGALYIAEEWGDLESYGWEKFKGYKRIPLAPKENPICLYLINKGGDLRQRNIETWTGHTQLVNFGYFFNSKQIQSADEIFERFRINKIDMTEAK